MERVHPVTDITEIDNERLNSLKGFEVALESFLNRYADAQAPEITALEGVERLDRILKESRLGADTRVQVEEWMSLYGELANAPELPNELRRRISHMLLDVQSRLTEQTSDMISDSAAAASFVAQDARERFVRWRERSGITPDSADLPADITMPANSAPMISRTTESLDVPTDDSIDTSVDDSIAAKLGAADQTVAPKLEESDRPTKPAQRKMTLRRQPEAGEISLVSQFFELVWSEMEYLEHIADSDQHALTALDEMISLAETKTDPMYHHLAGSFVYFLKGRGYKMAPYVQRLRQIRANEPD